MRAHDIKDPLREPTLDREGLVTRVPLLHVRRMPVFSTIAHSAFGSLGVLDTWTHSVQACKELLGHKRIVHILVGVAIPRRTPATVSRRRRRATQLLAIRCVLVAALSRLFAACDPVERLFYGRLHVDGSQNELADSHTKTLAPIKDSCQPTDKPSDEAHPVQLLRHSAPGVSLHQSQSVRNQADRLLVVGLEHPRHSLGQ